MDPKSSVGKHFYKQKIVAHTTDFCVQFFPPSLRFSKWVGNGREIGGKQWYKELYDLLQIAVHIKYLHIRLNCSVAVVCLFACLLVHAAVLLCIVVAARDSNFVMRWHTSN